ncbi:MAG: histidine--tRNA ligase, partial [Oscillospiraceae bacterium]|nr:histidine--tRNA ligase [Oscillospiraceae bacterium]
GSVCSGGRYDNLAEYYTDKKLPGVGISIGLTRLFFVLEDQGYLNSELLVSPTDVLVIPMTDDLSTAISLSTAMRNEGIRVQIHTEKKKFKAKMSYADKIGVPFIILLGEDEIKAGRVTVKDMRSGDQITVSQAMAIKGIKDNLAELGDCRPIREPIK